MHEAGWTLPLFAFTLGLCWTQANFKCLPHSDPSFFREELISQFKQKILKQLGYSAPPNVTLQPSEELRREMSHQYNLLHQEEQDSHRLTTRLYRGHHTDAEDLGVKFEGVMPLYTATFKVDRSSQHSHQLQKAWLSFCSNVPLKSRHGRHHQTGRLHVYVIEKEAGFNRTSRHLVYSRPMKSLTSACLNIDVTGTVKDKFAGNLTFVAVFVEGRPSTPEQPSDRGVALSHIRSTLLLDLAEKRKAVREKREVGKMDCSPQDGEKRCCRYHTYISFKEIDWDDWVIAPEGYDAYYCAGECPHRYKMAHNFAGIKSLLHIVDPSRIPPPTCSATRLKPLIILHLDDTGTLTYSNYDDMIVEECKCS